MMRWRMFLTPASFVVLHRKPSLGKALMVVGILTSLFTAGPYTAVPSSTTQTGIRVSATGGRRTDVTREPAVTRTGSSHLERPAAHLGTVHCSSLR